MINDFDVIQLNIAASFLLVFPYFGKKFCLHIGQ